MAAVNVRLYYCGISGVAKDFTTQVGGGEIKLVSFLRINITNVYHTQIRKNKRIANSTNEK